MRKKFLSIILIFFCSLFFLGCNNYSKNYAMNKEIKIEDNLTEVEINNCQKEIQQKLNDETNKIVLSAKINYDSGQMNTMYRKGRITIDIDTKIIADVEDKENLKAQCKLEGTIEETLYGKSIKKQSIDINLYLKDDYLYVHFILSEILNENDEEIKNIKEEKFKTPIDKIDVPEIGGISISKLPTNKEELDKIIDDIIKQLKETPGVEIGKDKKNNLVIQCLDMEHEEHKCLLRLVFSKGYLVFAGVDLSKAFEFLSPNGVGTFEAGVSYNTKDKIKFPNFDEYKELE